MSASDLLKMNTNISDDPLYVYNNNGDRIDISLEPTIDEPNLVDTIKSELLIRDGKNYSRYRYNGVPVPRVTSILGFCEGDNEALLQWASRLGDRYNSTRQMTLDVGTKVHDGIEEFLDTGNYHIRGGRGKNEVIQSLKNFKRWYHNVTQNLGWKVEVVALEIPLICPWFGGTADGIMIINNKRYLVDFKSSKKISDSYFIQVSAYKWMIDNYYPEYGPIDGIGILRFDKFKPVYEDVFLEMCVPEDAAFINHCQSMFGLALNMFYNNEVLSKEVKGILKDPSHRMT